MPLLVTDEEAKLIDKEVKTRLVCDLARKYNQTATGNFEELLKNSLEESGLAMV